jgi:hypothetical protein
MAASAGTITLLGRSGRTYTISAYIPDAVATYWTLNPAGLAGTASPTSYRVPENCTLAKIDILAAPIC